MICAVDGCDQLRRVRGWCDTHYRRWRRAGSVQADVPFRIMGNDPARFWSHVQKQPGDGCWLWAGATNRGGYGRFDAGQSSLAHCWAWIQEHGPVPEGLELDHRCRTPACVRPSHLEPVTHRENVLRGESPSAVNARKTHCPRGHPLGGTNLAVDPQGHRRCRACKRERQSRSRRMMHSAARS